jgi:3-hydroxybutyryl-CoA dehydrogenase
VTDQVAIVAVIGAGTMGAGIAQVCASAGHNVLLYDTQESALERGLGTLEKSLDRLIQKEASSETDKQATLERITPTRDLSALASAEVVIEAVFENLEVKGTLWRELSSVVHEDALLATNTSSLSVTEIATGVTHPERFCGLHFFNPVPLLPLVEVVQALQSSEETLGRAVAFTEAIGKTPIRCNDTPGFIVNRLLIPYLSDAVHALSEGVGSAEDIDSAMKLGANMPIGPLALLDLVGLDVALAAADSLYAEFGDPKFRVPPLLRQFVRAGKLGRKSGEGFYTYPS